MVRLPRIAFALLIAIAPFSARAQNSAPDVIIEKAAFVAGQTWVLTFEGKILTFAPGDAVVREAPVDGRALAICSDGGSLGAITQLGGAKRSWRFSWLQPGGDHAAQTIDTKGERIAGLVCQDRSATIVTTRRLVRIGPKGVDVTALTEDLAKIPPFRPSAILDAGARILVGTDAGEWGGRLIAIEKSTGRVQAIKVRSDSGKDLYDAENIQGLIPNPWRPGCVLATIGLVHFSPDGKVVNVCGQTVTTVFSKPFEVEGKSEGSVAFYGIVQSGNGVLAYGIDGLYRLSDNAGPTFQPRPKMKPVGPFQVSYDLPGVVALAGRSNGGMSVGVQVLTLIAR